jgi:dimethylamine/trimethylamine dehydrogenase
MGACAAATVRVTAEPPKGRLFHSLTADRDALARAGIPTLVRIGNAFAPGTIAAAVPAGHLFARSLAEPEGSDDGFLRERIALDAPFDLCLTDPTNR